jgi:hypothetical protein
VINHYRSDGQKALDFNTPSHIDPIRLVWARAQKQFRRELVGDETLCRDHQLRAQRKQSYVNYAIRNSGPRFSSWLRAEASRVEAEVCRSLLSRMPRGSAA